MNSPPPWHKLLLTVHVATAVSVLCTDLVLGISSVRGLTLRPSPGRSRRSPP